MLKVSKIQRIFLSIVRNWNAKEFGINIIDISTLGHNQQIYFYRLLIGTNHFFFRNKLNKIISSILRVLAESVNFIRNVVKLNLSSAKSVQIPTKFYMFVPINATISSINLPNCINLQFYLKSKSNDN